MSSNPHLSSLEQPLAPPGFSFQAWYCPGLCAYRRPGAPEASIESVQLPWIPLYARQDGLVPEGWTLRSYYVPSEDAFYASHRTMSEKVAKQAQLVELYAPAGAAGNEHAGHVPPKQS